MSELTTTIITQPMKPALSVKNKRFVKSCYKSRQGLVPGE